MLEIWEIPEAAIDMKNSSKRWTFKTHSKELLLYQNGSFLVQICIFEEKKYQKNTDTNSIFGSVCERERDREKKLQQQIHALAAAQKLLQMAYHV